MKLTVLALALGAQAAPPAPSPVPGQSAPASSEPARPEPWTGAPEEAVRELRRLSLDGDHSDALELAGRALLASREPESPWSESRRAELDYGVGLTLLLAGDDLRLDVRADAQSAFDSAAALAGPGSLRLDALYNGALVHLQWAEHRRREIPEVVAAQAAGLPGVTGGPLQTGGMPQGPPGSGAEEEAPDPLDLARASYLQAREGFVHRLRADWQDADTAANLELIERRLEELDEIERQREEQEEEQQGGEDSAPSEGGEEQENEEEQEDQESQSEQEPGEDEQEQEQQQEPPPGEDEQEQEPEEPEEQESEPHPPEEAEPGEVEPPTEQPEPSEAAAEETHLTREEVVRLLDRLEKLEQDARELERAIQRQRRIPVERDW